VLRFDEAAGAADTAPGDTAAASPAPLPTGAPTFTTTRPPLSATKAFGMPIAVLTSFGCHPVTVHSYRNLYSPDYPGYLRSAVRGILGEKVVVLFALGLAGDINPAGYVRGGTSPAWARQVGSILGCEVARVALDPLYMEDPPLRAACQQIDLPLSPLPPAAELRRLRDQFAAEADRLKAAGTPWKEASIPAIQRDWAEDALQEWERGALQRTIPCELQALRIGDVALLACPLELFTETGLAIRKESPARLTLFVTNANGGIGYLPTWDAYHRADDYANPQGLAPRVYGIYALAEGAEPLARQAAVALLQSLF
jgi:neutral ceramidase